MNSELERLLGTTVTGQRPLGGVTLVTTADRRMVVVKRAAGPRANAAEAASLQWLAASGDVPTPAVYGHDETFLLTEYVPTASPTPEAAEAFGRGLAALHLRGAPAFGAAPPNGPSDAWIGHAPMRNAAHNDWPSFYAADRVEPYVQMARDAGALSPSQADVITSACEHLDVIGGSPEPPARLHGDLWSGNLHWGALRRRSAVWLLDPAAHGGHRETDLAMLRLFGAPLLERILAAYTEAAADAGAPLADGWTERVGLHQLFPLLVHTVLFGGGYATQAAAAARSALALR